MLAAKKMDVIAGLGRGDPSGIAAPGGDPPVQAGRRLEGDERNLSGDVLEIGLVQAAVPLLEDARRRLEPGSLEGRETPPVHEGIGIDGRYDRSREARAEEAVDAGRRPAPVDAGLEREIDGPALGPSPGPGQGDDLGVRPAGFLVVAPADDGVRAR